LPRWFPAWRRSGCAFPECRPGPDHWSARPGSEAWGCPAEPWRCRAAASCPTNTAPPSGWHRQSGGRSPAPGQCPCGQRLSGRPRWPDFPGPSDADSRRGIRSGFRSAAAGGCGLFRSWYGPAVPRCRRWGAPAPAASSCWWICPHRSGLKSRRRTLAGRSGSDDRPRCGRCSFCTGRVFQ